MLKSILKLILKCIIFCFLTALTQIGGIVYICSELFIKKTATKYRIKKLTVFVIIYLASTFILIPYIAPLFGREKIQDNPTIEAHTFFTKLCNRNYVTPKLHSALKNIARNFQKNHPNSKIIYLDANFPFVNGFPLPPHVSHNDGKKIDISFVYKDLTGNNSNDSPSILGYGVYENPKPQEYNQPKICIQKGYWQYDFAKFLTFGIIKKELILSEKVTKDLLLAIVHQKEIGKVFIEPHLKNRLGVQNSKIRFHGCHAVRHDDHIHFQLK